MARSSLIVILSGPLLLAACSSDGNAASADGGTPEQRVDSGGDGADDPAGDGDGATPAAPRGTSAYFPGESFFTEDVYDSAKAAHSDATIAALRAAGGWGNGDFFQIDFSMEVLTAAAGTPTRTFTPRTEQNGFDYDEFYSPDCDALPIPIPDGGNLEGEAGYACSSDGDCHLIVWQPGERKLYEAWRAHIDGGEFVSGCLAVWDTSRAVTHAGRGLQCTSADAAGFPIAPLLFTADEVAAGEISHAIRFILPNDRVQRGFVPPATHATNTTGPAGAPYYGVHLRLRRDYPLEELPSEGARVVARALQRYGMYHADGGNIALTAQSDRHTTAKWDDLLGPHDLGALSVEDFEVIDHGAPIELTYDCVRE
jgi:serine/threonine-protein kinase